MRKDKKQEHVMVVGVTIGVLVFTLGVILLNDWVMYSALVIFGIAIDLAFW